jgi:Asp-tRNA(Asn)/Glu-tRNA(Gln) amidotransferase A subunit family amidase
VSTLAARIRARKVSAVEVIDAVADRIKRFNPKLNAYVTLDLENARKDAEMKHRMRKEHPDGDLGLLHGVPVAIKDDLALWEKQAESGKAESRAAAQQVLQHWQADPDLASVRDKATRAKLLDTEHVAREKLWADVEALRKRPRETK